MFRTAHRFPASVFGLTLFTLIWTGPSLVQAQGGGGLGGAGSFSGSSPQNSGYSYSQNWGWAGIPQPSLLPPDYALGYVTIEGTATMRLKPTEIRVVMAVTSEGDSAEACQTACEDKIAAVRRQWQAMDVPQDKIVEDFIAVLPKYRWDPEDRNGYNALVEHRDGYRMQTNLHLAVPTEAAAMAAIKRAFAEGVSDVITFDYWSPQLDQTKREARKKAIAVAKEKSDTLLSVFDQRPPIVNVQEHTYVQFPRHQYTTFTNSLEEESYGWSSSKVRIRAFRPKLTFYDSLQMNADVRPNQLAMHPEIAVISTVRLYYESPGRQSVAEKNQVNGSP